MAEDKYQHYPVNSGVMLRDAFPEVLPIICNSVAGKESSEFEEELYRVRIFSQYLTGVPSDFSFMASAVPIPTYEELLPIELVDERRVEINYLDAHISINLNDFGFINWFYVTGFPEMYEAINKFMPKPKEPILSP
jgi:hypothetical protein